LIRFLRPSQRSVLPARALALCLGVLAAAGAAAQDAVLSWTRKDSLQGYLRATSGKPRATKTVVVPAVSYARSGGAALEVRSELSGEKNVLAWTNGEGWVEYRVAVPESALYLVGLEYYPLPAKGMSIEVGFEVDGSSPFSDAEAIVLDRIWRDAEEIRRDPHGNDVLPRQEEAPAWSFQDFKDTQGFYNQAYSFYLTAGEHRLRVRLNREAFALKELRLHPKRLLPAYADRLAGWKAAGARPATGMAIKIQAEKTSSKSDSSLVPTYDKSDPFSEPFSAAKIRRNTLGQWPWKTPGMWAAWKLSVPEDGLYRVTFKARQNFQRGMSVNRHFLVDGEIPFKEAESVEFAYGLDWTMRDIGSRSDPGLVFLGKGEHELRLEASLGRLSGILNDIDDYAYQLNGLYRKFIMIMGADPDLYRDYQLEREVPGLKDFLIGMSVKLSQCADDFETISGQRGSEAATLRLASSRLRGFAKKPETIPKRLKTFGDSVNDLASWIIYRREQPLELDYILVSAPGGRLPRARADILTRAVSDMKSFIASFTEDYTTIGKKARGGGKGFITVWAGSGRDQAQIIMDLVNDSFMPETGIFVNLSLVQGGLIEATLAGKGPDVSIQVARGQPVNLAARGALADLSGYSGFREVASRFAPGALVPYEYRNGTYGLPVTQNFYMMFYRKDILGELGIEPPRTWDDVYRLIPVLQRNNMEFGLPIQDVDAQNLIDAGMGARNLFPTLLAQNGGAFYLDDFTRSGLDSPEAIKAFTMWTDFYIRYGFNIKFDFSNRFRTGQMPMGIASYTLFNQLYLLAPEIRNEWGMLPIPGTRAPDGSVDRSEPASGSACVMFEKAKDKDACWKFLEWWTRPDVQYAYARQLEILMGPAARMDTANLGAFDKLAWSPRDARSIKEQWRSVKEIPEVPGGYFSIRAVDMAFNSVFYNNSSPREVLTYYNKMVNEEIERKRKELADDAE
jgi:ABC-type glycerol-3-phosphate transport system substrate-binding protein